MKVTANLKVKNFVTLVNRLKSMDEFVYLKLVNTEMSSKVYLPQKDLVKTIQIPIAEILEKPSDFDDEIKISLFNGGAVINALKHFNDAKETSIEISYTEFQDPGDLGSELYEHIADTITISNSDLSISLNCADPSLGFIEMTDEQISAAFSKADKIFGFRLFLDDLIKVQEMFKLDSNKETVCILINKEGIHFKGGNYDMKIDKETTSDETHKVLLYKKHIGFLDKDDYEVTICQSRTIFDSVNVVSSVLMSNCVTDVN
jgi:hypothetical protein